MTEALERLDLSGLKSQVTTFSRFFASLPANSAAAMHGTIVQIHGLCSVLAELPPALWGSPEAQQVLVPALELHGRSSFVRRLREWPRGYPGDFETIELLVKGRSSHVFGLLARYS